ncbi:excalibur calcium-binding domain-containing protein [Paeniglutamicibacter antarcticus]|uniref:Excalibur calcium-binding domain-containing protein n=1 Tax=Paeniglutamicibacter antarcticus TaxID=494023 RepID=A0ABP9TLC2_9MICC
MSTNWVQNPLPRRRRGPKFWLFWALAAVLVIILLIVAPMLVFLLSIIAFIIGLVALVRGRMKWARIPHRAGAGALTGAAGVLFIVSTLVFGSSLPEPTATPGVAAEAESAAPTETPDLASFLGQSCDADHLVMTQGTQNNYCDQDNSGALVWVDQATHQKTEETAKATAEKKAADQAKASEEAAEKKAADAQAKQDADAKAKQDAAKKSAAEAKAKQQAEAKPTPKPIPKAKAPAKPKVVQPAPQKPQPKKKSAPSATYYKNCTAVRAAGADPIYRGDPGYSSKLDRDGDGVACE